MAGSTRSLRIGLNGAVTETSLHETAVRESAYGDCR